MIIGLLQFLYQDGHVQYKPPFQFSYRTCRLGTKTEIMIVTNVKVNAGDDTFAAICCRVISGGDNQASLTMVIR